MLTENQIKKGVQEHLKVVDSKGKIYETFRFIASAKRWVEENQLWHGELKVEEM